MLTSYQRISIFNESTTHLESTFPSPCQLHLCKKVKTTARFEGSANSIYTRSPDHSAQQTSLRPLNIPLRPSSTPQPITNKSAPINQHHHPPDKKKQKKTTITLEERTHIIPHMIPPHTQFINELVNLSPPSLFYMRRTPSTKQQWTARTLKGLAVHAYHAALGSGRNELCVVVFDDGHSGILAG